MKRDTSNDQALPTLEVEQATHLSVLLHARGGASCLLVLLHTGGGASCLPVLLHAGGGASCLPVLLHAGGGGSCLPVLLHAGGGASCLPVLLHAGGGASYLPVLLHTGGGASYPPASPPPHRRCNKLLTCQSSSWLLLGLRLRLSSLLASWCTRTARCLHTCTQCINIHTPAKAPPHARSMATRLYKPCLQR